MKEKFLKFVKERWTESEYASIKWRSDLNTGIIVFHSGRPAYFTYDEGHFYVVEVDV